MGLMDSLKKATGLGLSPAEQYSRAFEKAVLLGEKMYPEAVRLFDAASRRAAEAGDTHLQTKALANARLYTFITTADTNALPELHQALSQLTEIEAIGSQTEFMPSGPLAIEIEGRLKEAAISTIPETDDVRLAGAHLDVADTFKRIFDAPLVTYTRCKPDDPHTDRAQARFFFHHGLSAWHQARAAATNNPNTAAEHMAKALNSFHQCKNDLWSKQTKSWLENCRQQRTCWMCQREFQGNQIHFEFVPATVAPYVDEVLGKLGHDRSSIDIQRGALALCTPCRSAIEHLADEIASQKLAVLKAELMSALQVLQQNQTQLDQRLRYVESLSHTH